MVKKLNPFKLHLLSQREDGFIKKNDFRSYAKGDLNKITSLESHNLINW
jgi:hypothetical protein